MIECHSTASKSPWHDYVIHELKTNRKKSRCENFHVPASRVRYLICDTRSRWKCHAYNAFKTVHFQSNKIKRRYLERAHINGRTDVIRRQIDNNINILLSFCCAVEQGMRSTGGDNSNKGCLGSPMNNFMSSRKFRPLSRIFRWHSP